MLGTDVVQRSIDNFYTTSIENIFRFSHSITLHALTSWMHQSISVPPVLTPFPF